MSSVTFSRSRARALAEERGSAVVEFLLVAVLLIALSCGVVQLALFLHVRNTVSDAATEGARRAALVGESSESGVALTRGLITMALGAHYAQDISATVHTWDRIPAVAVTVSAPLPLIGLWGPPSVLHLTGRAPLEYLAGKR